MNDIDLEELEVDDEEEEEVMNNTSSNNSTNSTNISTLSDSTNNPQSIQSIATHAAAAMAAAMAAQQLLACATAICGIDLASLSNFALLAGQAPGMNGGNPTPEQLMAAAVATHAFLSPNHLVPQDLTMNQSSGASVVGGLGGIAGANNALANNNNNNNNNNSLRLSPSALALAASTQTSTQPPTSMDWDYHNNINNNNNITNSSSNDPSPNIRANQAQVNQQVLPDLLALELANHLRQQQQQLQHKQSQQQQQQQQQQHNQLQHLSQQQQAQQQQQPQPQPQQQAQAQSQQTLHHGAHHHLLGAHHNHNNIQLQQPQQTQHHRHHHLLGGHHHHSSIQTQQQLLATKGFNPMAVVVGSGQQTEILTPTHLRKAKLMFFYVRYPSSSTLKECFRDVRFNKNNTAQLVKWFSNFREFYYIQMEKFARDAVADDRIQCKEDIVVDFDHELINQLNNHYNKNRHIDLPEPFRIVVEETLRHFFDAIHNKRDQEQSWKKAIYKLIQRLDQEVPDVFKTDAFNEHLE